MRANGYLAADKAAANSFIAKVTAAHVAIDALAWGAGSDKAAADAVAARDAARARLPKANPADADLATACELQDDWLAAARSTVSTRAAKKRTADAQAAARAPGNRARRLQAFVDVVTRNGLAGRW
jgi:hypothetical protein